MHYFIHTDNTNIPVQAAADAYGPDSTSPADKFNITSVFQLTGQTKAFACQDSLMIVQQSSLDNSLVNVILKPADGLNVPFRSIKYFVYRGLLKSSFINGTAIAPQAGTNTEFIARFWSDWNNYKTDTNQPGLADPTPQIFGYDTTLPGTLEVEKIYDSSQPDIQAVLVKEGEWIGDFGSSFKMGFEIVMGTAGFPVDLNYLKTGSHQVDVTGLSGLDLRAKREQALSFIDPAAFFGLHYDAGVNITTYSGTNKVVQNKKEDDLYTTLLVKFATKNRVYLDIRNEQGYSYNFYQNYDDGSGNNIKKGNSTTALVAQGYSTNGWPLVFIDSPLTTSATQNDVKLNLRIDDNIKPILFLENTGLLGSTNRARFMDDKTILNGSAVDWSEDLTFVFPNTGSGSAKDNVACYVRLHYFRQSDSSTVWPVTVLKTENYTDNIFGNIDHPDLFQATPTSLVTFNDTKFPNGQFDSRYFGYTQKRNAYYDSDSIVFTCSDSFPYKKSEDFFDEIISGTKFQIALDSDSFKDFLSFKKVYFDQIPLEEETSPSVYQTVPVITFASNGQVIASKENLFLLNISKDEFDKQQSVSGFSPDHRRYINLEQLLPPGSGDSFTDRNGLSFFKYKLVVQGLDPSGKNLRKSLFDDTSNPADDVFVYSTDKLAFSSKKFLDNKVNEITLEYQSSENYDEFIFQVTVPELPNTFQIAQLFRTLSNNKTPKEADLIALNKKLNTKFNETTLHKGDIIYLPKGTLNYLNNLGGNLTSAKTIRIAWTFDDGPSKNVTLEMLKAVGRIQRATWFIMRNKIAAYGVDNFVSLYKGIQDKGGEIGIHSMHLTKDHTTWFPTSYENSHTSITEAMDAMDNFNNFLITKGITAKFARPPYGLKSEIMSYLKKLGFVGNADAVNTMANKIISGQPLTDPNALTVKADLDTMKTRLTGMGLKLGVTWPTVKNLDWDAESSGTGLTDNITNIPNYDPSKPSTKGLFERTSENTYNDTNFHYLVVLAHDTLVKNVEEVKRDLKQMEYYASYIHQITVSPTSLNARYDKEPLYAANNLPTAKDGVKIEYHTMSSLYDAIP